MIYCAFHDELTKIADDDRALTKERLGRAIKATLATGAGLGAGHLAGGALGHVLTRPSVVKTIGKVPPSLQRMAQYGAPAAGALAALAAYLKTNASKKSKGYIHGD